MKHLFLVANTPVDRIELALQKVNSKLEAEGKEALRYDLLFGKTMTPHKTYQSDVVLLLGSNSFRINQGDMNHKAVGIMFGDPMNLSYIKGKCVVPLDFKPKEDGYGYFLQRLELSEISAKILKAVKSPDVANPVTIDVLDPIPNIIGAINEATSFVQHLSALNYSIRSELVRTRLKSAFLKWCADPAVGIDSLRAEFIKVGRFKESNPRLQAILNVFEGKRGASIKKGISTVIKAVKEKKPGFNYERLASNLGVSPYDLRYIAQMVKKNKLLLADVSSEAAHESITKGRYVLDQHWQREDARAEEGLG